MNKDIKKIAILYSGGRYFGGIENYLLNLFRYSDAEDIQLTLISLGDWDLTRKIKHGDYDVKIFSGKRISFKTINDIGKYLTEQKFNLIVSNGMLSSAYSRVITHFYHIPTLTTVHSLQAGDYQKVLPRTIYSMVDRILRPQTSHYIVVSKYLRDQLIKSGIDPRKITVVYNGLEVPKATPKPHKRLVIGSVGRLHPVKGYDTLIKAFANIDNKRIRLKIAGSGDELSNLKRLSKELNVADRVEFVGFEKNVYKFLNGVDVYVQSSRFEGFGLALIEAMSQEIPVVVTPAGSLTELVADEKTGFISKSQDPVDLAKAINKSLINIDNSCQIGKNARKFVLQNFSIDKWIESTLNIYRKVAK